MLFKTLVAAALVASAAAYSASDLPACWSDCFAKYEAEEECLCSTSLGNVVSHCIAKGCDPASNEAYVEWLSDYCVASVPPTVSNTWVPPASTAPAYPATTPPAPSYPAGSAPPAPQSYPPAPAPSGYPPAPSGYPPAGGLPPYPYGSVSGSVCVETSTLIWRHSTSVTTYSVTASPSGWASPSSYAPSGVTAPTGGVWPSRYSPRSENWCRIQLQGCRCCWLGYLRWRCCSCLVKEICLIRSLLRLATGNAGLEALS